MNEPSVFGLVAEVMRGAITPDENLMQVMKHGIVSNQNGPIVAALIQLASGRGMGAIVEYFDHSGRLLLRLPLASGRDATRRLLGPGTFEERSCGQMWCCERQAIKIFARLREAYPVASLVIYGTKPRCRVCNRRLLDMEAIDRVHVAYHR